MCSYGAQLGSVNCVKSLSASGQLPTNTSHPGTSRQPHRQSMSSSAAWPLRRFLPVSPESLASLAFLAALPTLPVSSFAFASLAALLRVVDSFGVRLRVPPLPLPLAAALASLSGAGDEDLADLAGVRARDFRGGAGEGDAAGFRVRDFLGPGEGDGAGVRARARDFRGAGDGDGAVGPRDRPRPPWSCVSQRQKNCDSAKLGYLWLGGCGTGQQINDKDNTAPSWQPAEPASALVTLVPANNGAVPRVTQ